MGLSLKDSQERGVYFLMIFFLHMHINLCPDFRGICLLLKNRGFSPMQMVTSSGIHVFRGFLFGPKFIFIQSLLLECVLVKDFRVITVLIHFFLQASQFLSLQPEILAKH